MIARNEAMSLDGSDLEQLVEMIADRVAEKLASRPIQKFVSLKELATITGLGERTIARWKSRGKLPFETAGRRVLFPKDQALLAISELRTTIQ